MKVALQLVGVFLLCTSSSCNPQPIGESYISEKIPVQIQRNRHVTIEIRSLSGNGDNQVGIRCSPEFWSALTTGATNIIVRLKSSEAKDTQIGGISPGSGRRWPIESFHYLFYISGKYHTKASVEIAFPSGPQEATSAEIIVCKTPADTGP